MRACFTGHRPQNLPWGFEENDTRCILLKQRMQSIITKLHEQCHVLHYISGMGLGVDTWAAEIVLEMKQALPCITLEAAIPFQSQTVRWTQESKDRYEAILSKCDKITTMRDINGRDYERYTGAAMWQRNRYLVDNADYVFAVWDSAQANGGTYGTVEYARAQNKAIILLNPITLKTQIRKVRPNEN